MAAQPGALSFTSSPLLPHYHSDRISSLERHPLHTCSSASSPLVRQAIASMMEDESGAYERAAQALAALRDALKSRPGAGSTGKDVPDALKTVQKLLSGTESLKVSVASCPTRTK